MWRRPDCKTTGGTQANRVSPVLPNRQKRRQPRAKMRRRVLPSEYSDSRVVYTGRESTYPNPDVISRGKERCSLYPVALPGTHETRHSRPCPQKPSQGCGPSHIRIIDYGPRCGVFIAEVVFPVVLTTYSYGTYMCCSRGSGMSRGTYYSCSRGRGMFRGTGYSCRRGSGMSRGTHYSCSRGSGMSRGTDMSCRRGSSMSRGADMSCWRGSGMFRA